MQLENKPKELLQFLRSSETAFLFFFALLVGVVTGFAGLAFHYMLEFFKYLFFEKGTELFGFMGKFSVALIPAIGGLIIGPLIFFLSKETKGHGVPEVMLAVRTKGGIIRPRVAFLKALNSSICIGSGGSAGREGPIVQIGSALGSAIGQFFRLSEEKIKILVACGAGSGIASTFNAPLAGIFFALEVILGEYGPRFFSAVVLSSVTSTIISRSFLGDHPAFSVPVYQLNTVWEIPLYVIFGFVSALVALAYVRFLYKTEDAFDKWKFPGYLKPAVGGLAVGLIGVFYPDVFGVGYSAMESALHGTLPFKLVAVLVIVKIVSTSFTLGSGGSGGVFAPSLFIGAMLGAAYGKLTGLFLPDIAISPGACALVGMASVFAGASLAPISAIFIVFEMTDDYKIILPLMITCIISSMFVRRLARESIYTLKLKRRGIDIQKLTGMDLMERITIGQASFKNVITVQDTQKVREAGLMIKSTSHRGFPVVNNDGDLVGMVTREDINKALAANKSDIPAHEIMTKELVVGFPDETLRDALEKFGKKNIGRIPVVQRTNKKKLIGIITRKGIISAYNEALLEREVAKGI